MVQLSAFEFETTVSKKCLKIAELLKNRRRIELLSYARVRSLEILCYKTTVSGKSNRVTEKSHARVTQQQQLDRVTTVYCHRIELQNYNHKNEL